MSTKLAKNDSTNEMTGPLNYEELIDKYDNGIVIPSVKKSEIINLHNLSSFTRDETLTLLTTAQNISYYIKDIGLKIGELQAKINNSEKEKSDLYNEYELKINSISENDYKKIDRLNSEIEELKKGPLPELSDEEHFMLKNKGCFTGILFLVITFFIVILFNKITKGAFPGFCALVEGIPIMYCFITFFYRKDRNDGLILQKRKELLNINIENIQKKINILEKQISEKNVQREKLTTERDEAIKILSEDISKLKHEINILKNKLNKTTNSIYWFGVLDLLPDTEDLASVENLTNIVRSRRADNLKEALNVYSTILHQQRMEHLEKKQLNASEIAAEEAINQSICAAASAYSNYVTAVSNLYIANNI